MGRKLRRVPLDFDWPMNQTWKGFLNPFGGPCPEDEKTCFSGYTAAGKWLDAIVRMLMLAGEEGSNEGREEEFAKRGRSYPHPWLTECNLSPRTDVPRFVHTKAWKDYPTDSAKRMRSVGLYLRDNPPKLLPLTKELAELTSGLAGRGPSMLGHDGCDSYAAFATIRKAAGLDDKWGVCKVCEGQGDNPATRQAAEDWKPESPPTGDGFQLWETTSEGSPISPVFDTLEKLCTWCAKNATTFGSETATKEEWMNMLDADNVHHRSGNLVFI